MLRFLFFKLAQGLSNVLPLNISYVLSVIVGKIFCLTKKDERRRILRNFSYVFPNSSREIAHLPQEVFSNFGRYMVEFFRMPSLSQSAYIRDHVRFEGFDEMKGILERRQKVIIATGHMGNWEMGAAILGGCGYPIKAVAWPHKEPIVNRFFDRQRARCGVGVIQSNRAVKDCLSALRRNDPVALVADWNLFSTNRETEFFGQKAHFPWGAAFLSLRSEAPLIPSFLIRTTPGNFLLKAFPALWPQQIRQKYGNLDRSAEQMMRYFFSCLEEMIKTYPGQWMSFREFAVK